MPFKCTQCEESIITQEMSDEIHEKIDMLYSQRNNELDVQTKINSLMETSEEFRNEMIVYRKKYKEYTKQQKLFSKKLNEEKKRYKEQIQSTLMILKGTYESTVNAMLKTDEYKTLSNTLKNFRIYSKRLDKKYDISRRSLHVATFGRINYNRSWNLYNSRHSRCKYNIKYHFRIRIQ